MKKPPRAAFYWAGLRRVAFLIAQGIVQPEPRWVSERREKQGR